jgi:hypothetical protein
MTDVIRSGDCGNSPKNVLVESLSIALATGDIGGGSRDDRRPRRCNGTVEFAGGMLEP